MENHANGLNCCCPFEDCTFGTKTHSNLIQHFRVKHVEIIDILIILFVFIAIAREIDGVIWSNISENNIQFSVCTVCGEQIRIYTKTIANIIQIVRHIIL